MKGTEHRALLRILKLPVQFQFTADQNSHIFCQWPLFKFPFENEILEKKNDKNLNNFGVTTKVYT